MKLANIQDARGALWSIDLSSCAVIIDRGRGSVSIRRGVHVINSDDFAYEVPEVEDIGPRPEFEGRPPIPGKAAYDDAVKGFRLRLKEYDVRLADAEAARDAEGEYRHAARRWDFIQAVRALVAA